jgi:hypothetical protein
LIDDRGRCGGPFKPGAQGARVRRVWCSWSAEFVELGPVVGLDTIFGASIPADVAGIFQSEPDESGRVYFYEVDRCPLASIDPRSPEASQGWIDDVADASRLIRIGAPGGWLPDRPTAALTDGVVVLESQIEAASAWRSKNNEDW